MIFIAINLHAISRVSFFRNMKSIKSYETHVGFVVVTQHFIFPAESVTKGVY